MRAGAWQLEGLEHLWDLGFAVHCTTCLFPGLEVVVVGGQTLVSLCLRHSRTRFVEEGHCRRSEVERVPHILHLHHHRQTHFALKAASLVLVILGHAAVRRGLAWPCGLVSRHC